MFKGRLFKRGVIAGVFLLLMLANVLPAVAQGPVFPQHSDPAWQASYWNNTSLSGPPDLQRSDANLAFNWGTGSPAPGVINNDYFSARWTRYIYITTPDVYRFTVTVDDGVRVWVNDNLILDKWFLQAATTYTVDWYLGVGHHLVRVEYFEDAGQALINFNWQQRQVITEWRGEYFNNTTLSGSPALVRNDAAINFNWQAGSPAPGVINADGFSARWTRTMDIPAGMYTFSLTVDDGARLWVNGHLLFDVWFDGAARTYRENIYLPGGPIPMELHYYENTGLAVVQLSWAKAGVTPIPVPSGTVIVDDTDPGFVRGGVAAGWRTVQEGYGGSLTWTYNNRYIAPNYNWARWYPQLSAGRYEVFVYIPERYSTTARARYWVSHAGGFTLRIVNQSTNGGRWVSLGTYRFLGTGGEYVSLADVTYETYRTRLIAFDAVKWEPR